MSDASEVRSFPVRTLSEVTSRVTDGSHFSPVPQEHGYVIANVKDMKSGRIDFDSCTRISEAAFGELRATGCVIKKNNVLLSKDGTVGRVVVYESEQEIGALSSICLITPKEGMDPRFLGHALRSHDCVRQYENAMSGSALRRLVLRDIRQIRVPTPAIDEQVKLAQILDTLDATIRQTEAIIDKLKQVKQGLLHDLLTRGIDANGELRPPQSQAPHLYKESPLGWIAREWLSRPFGELAEFVNGNSFDASRWSEQGLPIIRIQNLNGSADFNFYDGPVNSKWHVVPGDLLFAWSGQRGVSFGPRIWAGPEGVLNQHIFRVTERESLVSKRYLFEALRSRQCAIEDSAHGFKDSFLHVTRGELGSVMAGIPPLAEQAAIAKRIEAFERRLNSELMTLAKCNALKSGLMDDLLTGRVRVTPLLDSPP